MSILVDKNTRLLVQGITGSAGAFHTRQCMEYGTNVVAGVTPGKGGQIFDETVPVFDTVWEARQETGCNVSMIFVPAAAAGAGRDENEQEKRTAGSAVDNEKKNQPTQPDAMDQKTAEKKKKSSASK